MKLSKEEIQHIADLARLDLSDKEIDVYGEQLSQVLSYIDQLQEVDTTGIEPTAQVTGLDNIMRADDARNWNESELDLAFRQSPEMENKQTRVKRILN
jgi:aspartyl-tRNA(Asn)/glutamyl-tRNA(Gln) amidotransferase subunit C